MWQCPNCDRFFKTSNQWHSCTSFDIGELFLGKPDDLVMAFDSILQAVASWNPNTIGPAKHTIVLTSKKAWLIIKPMTKVLDLKFYVKDQITSERIKKRTKYPNKYAHHIRVNGPDEVDRELIELLRLGFEYSLI